MAQSNYILQFHYFVLLICICTQISTTTIYSSKQVPLVSLLFFLGSCCTDLSGIPLNSFILFECLVTDDVDLASVFKCQDE